MPWRSVRNTALQSIIEPSTRNTVKHSTPRNSTMPRGSAKAGPPSDGLLHGSMWRQLASISSRPSAPIIVTLGSGDTPSSMMLLVAAAPSRPPRL